MNTCIVLTVIGALILVWYVAEKLKHYSIGETILKSLVSVVFMAVAVCALSVSGAGTYGVLITMGLLFGLLGDIWLDLKFVYRDDDTIYTYAGFIVFAVGHILFITAMLTRYADFSRPLYVIVPVVMGLALGVGNIFAAPIMKMDFGKFKIITMIYGAILGTTCFLSGSLALMHLWKVSTLNYMFVGTVLFLLSDLVLSGTYFGGKERPVDIILNYLFYYGGQFVIAWSLVFFM